MRLMLALRVFLKIILGSISVRGRNRLQNIPPGKKVIIATTHTSDLDLAIVTKALGHDFDLKLTHMSIHTSLKKSIQALDPTIIGIYLAGRNNFLPVSYTQTRGEDGKIQRAGQIRKEDFQAMQNALDKGKTIVLAGHNPTFDGKLPKHAGFAAVRLAQLVENSVVLPVSVKIGTGDKPLGIVGNLLQTMLIRPHVNISIGAPMEFNDREAKIGGDIIEAKVTGKSREEKARKAFFLQTDRLMQSLTSLSKT